VRMSWNKKQVATHGAAKLPEGKGLAASRSGCIEVRIDFAFEPPDGARPELCPARKLVLLFEAPERAWRVGDAAGAKIGVFEKFDLLRHVVCSMKSTSPTGMPGEVWLAASKRGFVVRFENCFLRALSGIATVRPALGLPATLL
jgi:hypothetical protein